MNRFRREDRLWELGHNIIDYEKCSDLQSGRQVKLVAVTQLEGLKTRAGSSTPPQDWIQGPRLKDNGISALEGNK